jgi:hypothetical protein
MLAIALRNRRENHRNVSYFTSEVTSKTARRFDGRRRVW